MPDKYGKATDTQSEYLIIIAFREQKWPNAPQRYVMRTLPVL
jgi:hypothetical protein